MAQILVPVADQAVGSWSTTPLWSKVDDDSTVSPTGDGSTIQSEGVGNNTQTTFADLQLAAGSTPQSGSHVLRARWNHNQSGRTMRATCELWQGVPGSGTLVATLQVDPDVGTTETESTYTLTSGEVSNISDYGALYVRLHGFGTGGGPSRNLIADLVELEIPDAGASPVVVQASPATMSAGAQAATPSLSALAVQAAAATMSPVAQVVSPQVAGGTLLSDDFTGTDGDPWDSGKWTTEWGAGGLVDIQANQGRLNCGTEQARAIGNHTAAADVELLVKTSLGQATNARDMRFILRGDGVWGGGGFPNHGYYVHRNTDSSTTDLAYRDSGGTPTVITTFTWANDLDEWWLRFRVEGTSLKVRVWKDGTSEPGTWDVDTTDSNISAAGVVMLSYERIAGSGDNDAFVDDLSLEDLSAAGGVVVQAAPAGMTVGAQPASPALSALVVPASPATLSPAAQAPAPTLAALSIQATPAGLTVTPQASDPVLAALVVQASPANLAITPQATDPTLAALAIQASPALLTTAAQTVDAVLAALAIQASAAELSIDPQVVNPVVSGAPVTIQASPGILTLTGQVTDPALAAFAIQASPAGLQIEAQTLDPVLSALTVQVTPAGLAIVAQATDPQAGGVVVQATPANLSTFAQTVDLVLAALAVTAAPVGLSLNAQPVTPARAGTVVSASPGLLSTQAGIVQPNLSQLAVSAQPAVLIVTASTVNASPAVTVFRLKERLTGQLDEIRVAAEIERIRLKGVK